MQVMGVALEVDRDTAVGTEDTQVVDMGGTQEVKVDSEEVNPSPRLLPMLRATTPTWASDPSTPASQHLLPQHRLKLVVVDSAASSV
jgi:hypothetical protein